MFHASGQSTRAQFRCDGEHNAIEVTAIISFNRSTTRLSPLLKMASRFASRPLKSATPVARLGRRNLATPTATPLQERDCRSITPPYEKLLATLQDVRKVLPRGTKLTLAEKILYSHVRSADDLAGAKDLGGIRGQRYLKLAPDRVAMQVSIASATRIVT